MIRRLVIPTLVVVVPLAILLVAGWQYVTSRQWASRRFHELLTIEVAQTLGVQVRIGAVSGNPLTGLRLQDVAIAEGDTLAQGVAATAEEVRVRYDLLDAVLHNTPAIESVAEVRLVRAYARLARRSDGTWNVDRLLRAFRRPRAGPGRFRGRVLVEDSEVAYTDSAPHSYWPSADGLRLGRLNGLADFANPRVVRWAARGSGVLAPFETIGLTGTYAQKTKALCAHGAVGGVHLADLYGRFSRYPGVQVRSGRAEVRGNVAFAPGDFTDYAVVGRAEDVTAEVAALEHRTVRAGGDFRATPAGIELSAVHAVALDTAIAAEGTVFNLASPSIDVRATASNVDPARWAEVAPALAKQLPTASGLRSATLAARVTGPLSDPDLSVAASFAAPVAVRFTPEQTAAHGLKSARQSVTATAQSLVLTASTPDLVGTRDAAVRVAAKELTVGDLGPLLPSQDYLHLLRPGPITNVSADLFYSQKTAASAGRIRIGEISTEHGELLGVGLRYALAGKALRARATVDSALGAEVAAEGLLNFGGKKPSLYATVEATGVDLATAASIARYQTVPLRGTADVTGVLSAEGDRTRGVAQLRGAYLGVGDLRFDQAAADVGLTRDGVDVRYAAASGPFGTWWAQGAIPRHAPVTGEFALADVPLTESQAAMQSLRRPRKSTAKRNQDESKPPIRLEGTAFVRGRLGGEPGSRELRADVAVFRPGVGHWRAEVVTGSLQATREHVELTGVRVRRGSGAAVADLALSDIHWPASTPLLGREPAAPTQAPGVPDVFDAGLSGHARVAGFDLSQLREFATLPEDLRLTGAATTDEVQLSGTIRRPRASGALAVTDVRALLPASNAAAGPLDLAVAFDVDPDEVVVREGSARSVPVEAGLNAQFSGKVGGWNTDRGASIDAHFSAQGLPITVGAGGGGPPLIDGVLDQIADGSVQGPLSGTGPSVRARASAQALHFGRREVDDLSAVLSYADGRWGASDLRLQVAGGHIEAPVVSYEPEEQKVGLEIGGQHLQARELLLWIGDIARQAADPADATVARDRYYSLAHRTRGELSVGKLTIDGPLDDLSGSLQGLVTADASLDQKDLPDVKAAAGFSGLNLSALAAHPQPGSAGAAASPAGKPFAHLHLDDVDLASRVRGGSVTAEGSVHWDGNVQLTAQADMVPLDELAAWLPSGWGLGGKAAVTAQVTGTVDQPEVTASLEVFDPTLAGVGFDLLQATRIELHQDALVLIGGSLKRQDHEVQVSGSVPFNRDRMRFDVDGPLACTATLDRLPLPVVLDLADEFARHQGDRPAKDSVWKHCQADGLLTASLDVSGTLESPVVQKGGLYIDPGATFRLDTWPKTTKIDDIRVDTIFHPPAAGTGAVVEALDVHGRLDQTVLGVQGQAQVSHLLPDEWLLNHIDPEHPLLVTAKAPQQRLPGGTLLSDLDAVLRLYTHPSGWQVFEVDHAVAKLGRGRAELSGRALLDTLDLAQLGRVPCNLHLAFDGAQVAWRPEVPTAQLDGVLAVTKFASHTRRPVPADLLGPGAPASPADPAASLRIASVARADSSVAAPLVVSRMKIAIPLPSKPDTGTPEAAPSITGGRLIYGLPPTWPTAVLDVAVSAGRDVQIASGRLQGAVRRDAEAIHLTGTPQAPTLTARMAMDQGRIQLLRGDLSISQAGAELSIKPAPEARPGDSDREALRMASRLWGRAEGTVTGTTASGESLGPVRVTLALSGGLPPDQVLTTTSNPPLSVEEINRLLALSPVQAGSSNLRGDQTSGNALLAETVSREILRNVVGPLEREVTSALGLSEFTLTVGVNQPAELRVGKYLVKNLLLSYRRGTGPPPYQYDLDLSYQISPKYQVSLHTDERERQDLRFEYRWNF